MSKTFYKVDDEFTGSINIAGQPKAYTGGDVIVLDDDNAEERNLVDLGVHNLSNQAKRKEALDALVENGDLTFGGTLPKAPATGTVVPWTIPFNLEDVAEGEVARCKPGFTGRVAGLLFQATEDATTSAKAASLGLSIDGTDLSDEINTVTVASGTTPFILVVTTPDDTFTTADIAYDASTSAVKAALVAAGIATGDVTVGGSAGAYTLTWTGDLTDADITVQALRHEIVTIVQDATGGTHTLTYDGANSQTVDANASQSAFQSAVDAATGTAGLVTVVRSGSANGYTYTLTGTTGANLAAFATNPALLTGGASTAAVSVVQQGGATNVSAGTTVAGGGVRIVGASGNPATLDLTSSNVTDGGVVAGETIATGTNANHGNFGPDDELVLSAASVTAFVEGAGVVVVNLLRTA